MNATDYKFVFVVTYGRSGSTVLMKLLNQLEAVEIRGENMNALFHVFRAVKAIEATKDLKGQLATSCNNPWYGAESVDPEAFCRHLIDAFVGNVLKPSEGAKVIGCKEVRFLPKNMDADDFKAFVKFLLTEFPAAKIVFNTRNGDDVSRSGWFKDFDSDLVKQWIAECDRRFQAANSASDRCYLIDYADLVNRTENLKGLFPFLGFTYSEETVHTATAYELTHMKQTAVPGLTRAKRVARSLFKRMH